MMDNDLHWQWLSRDDDQEWGSPSRDLSSGIVGPLRQQANRGRLCIKAYKQMISQIPFSRWIFFWLCIYVWYFLILLGNRIHNLSISRSSGVTPRKETRWESQCGREGWSRSQSLQKKRKTTRPKGLTLSKTRIQLKMILQGMFCRFMA